MPAGWKKHHMAAPSVKRSGLEWAESVGVSPVWAQIYGAGAPVLLQRDVSHHVRRSYPPFIAHTGSCAKPNSSRRLRLTNTAGLYRLSLVPAGRWLFPTLSLQSLRRCLDPCPVASLRCICSLLPEEKRPHLRRHKFGTPKLSR